MNALTERALEIASQQVGVRETQRNRGPQVDMYLASVNLDASKGDYPWCCAMLFYCFNQASLELRITNPMPRLASVMKLWNATPQWRKGHATPGSIFIIDHGGGRGHCGLVEHTTGTHGGLVEHTTGTHICTIEGNTNPGGSREGDGVYRRIRRYEDVMGYIDYALEKPRVELVG